MFQRKTKKGLLIGLLFVSIIALLVGCGPGRKNVNIDITDQNQPDPSQNQTPPQNQTPQNQTPPPATHGGEVDAPVDSNYINFLNINLVGGEPPLQTREGIFYFTKTHHPPEVSKSFRYDTHNGWLIQLEDPVYRGHKIKVQKIKRSGNIYDITVRLEPGGDVTKPAYGFFEVGITDMPITSKFRIYDEAGKKLWPKF